AEDDFIDLVWHEHEFREGYSFSYVVRRDDGRYLGCCYLYPGGPAGHVDGRPRAPRRRRELVGHHRRLRGGLLRQAPHGAQRVGRDRLPLHPPLPLEHGDPRMIVTTADDVDLWWERAGDTACGR